MGKAQRCQRLWLVRCLRSVVRASRRGENGLRDIGGFRRSRRVLDELPAFLGLEDSPDQLRVKLVACTHAYHCLLYTSDAADE